MKGLLLVLALGILVLGCTQQVPPAQNLSIPDAGAVMQTGETTNATMPSRGEETAAPVSPEKIAQPPAESTYANYDLQIKDMILNTSTPTLSQYSTLSVKVAYEGKQKPSRYKVSYYDGTTLMESKTVNVPQQTEIVNFNWLALSDGTHGLKAIVELFEDEKVIEDGPANNNAMEKQFEIMPIGTPAAAGGKEISKQFKRGQQFIVSNNIGIGRISIYLKADKKPDDVLLAVELRQDNFNKPGSAIKSSRISARDISAAQWYKFSYGLNGVFLTPGKYWIVVYLDEESANKPVWVSGSDYDGKSAVLDTKEGYGNIWKEDSGNFAFRVSTTP